MIETIKHYPQERFTIASLYDPESGELRIGLAFANKSDVFKKKLGYQKARGRAISSLPTLIMVTGQRMTAKEVTVMTMGIAEKISRDPKFFWKEVEKNNRRKKLS
jgi:hypothetical protein